MNINCIGPANHSGLGNAYSVHSSALSAIVDASVFDLRTPVNNDCPNVYYHGAPKLSRIVNAPGRTIAYWVCESSELSKAYFENEHRFTDLWTASEFCKEVLERELDREVKLVPHCVTRYCYSPKIREVPVVLVSFDTHSRFLRKNPIGALKAIKDAFGGKCHTIVKCKNLPDSYKKWLLKEGEGLDYFDVVDEELTVEEMDRLYSAADIYVGLHCGEGFGLQFLEAMAFGCKVVGTNWGGNTDFMNEENSFLVDYELVETSDEYFKGKWAKADHDSAVEQLRAALVAGFDVTEKAFETALEYSMSNTIKATLRAL